MRLRSFPAPRSITSLSSERHSGCRRDAGRYELPCIGSILPTRSHAASSRRPDLHHPLLELLEAVASNRLDLGRGAGDVAVVPARVGRAQALGSRARPTPSALDARPAGTAVAVRVQAPLGGATGASPARAAARVVAQRARTRLRDGVRRRSRSDPRLGEPRRSPASARRLVGKASQAPSRHSIHRQRRRPDGAERRALPARRISRADRRADGLGDRARLPSRCSSPAGTSSSASPCEARASWSPPATLSRIRSLADLARPSLRFVNRARGTGTRIVFDELLAGSDTTARDIARLRPHRAVAPRGRAERRQRQRRRRVRDRSGSARQGTRLHSSRRGTLLPCDAPGTPRRAARRRAARRCWHRRNGSPRCASSPATCRFAAARFSRSGTRCRGGTTGEPKAPTR